MSSGEMIATLRKRYTMLRGTETLMAAVACGAIAWGLAFVVTPNLAIAIPLSLSVTIVAFIVRARYLGLFSLTDERMAFFLNREFAELKDSSDLVLKPHSELSDLEQIQLQRTSLTLSRILKVKFPHKMPTAAAAMAITLISSAALMIYLPEPLPVNATEHTADSESPGSASPSSLSEYSLLIQPPAYTGIKPIETENLSANVPQGSDLTWRLRFEGPTDKALLQFTNGDSLLLALSEGQFVGTRKVDESVIYRVRWNTTNGARSSNYFEITAKPDEPPNVQIKRIEQFTRLKWAERTHVDVPVTLSDDFGLTQGHIIATVSKGSGESVKFREERLPFQSPAKITGTDVSASRRIDFRSLGMEPGDEVYFYAEAWDNKKPSAQRNRTETFFISLQDTATHVVTVDASLGVDLMPEYFRSQRQIIIDTEKLLRDKPKISKQVFNSTSNELGYDQKVLRLKYGQFLGEEFETTIGETAHQEEEKEDNEEDENDPAKKFGHQHDKDNEHNLVAPKKQELGHEHGEESEEEDLTNAYRHDHDNMEEATFFTMSVRAKLKAALTLMWESELQLRLFAPKESLPIQYKILKLLREISQDSRIYVHRMGFDPPPLKEDRRLTGDLEEIGNPKATSMAAHEDQYPAIRKALPAIQSALAQTPIVVDASFKAILEQAANEIAAASLERPGDYLIQLSQIRAIVDGTMNPSDVAHALEDIQAACWNILPPRESGPNQSEGIRHTLDTKLLEELKKPAND